MSYRKAAPYAIGVICLLLSFTITLQARSVRRNTALNNADNIKLSSLQTQLQRERELNAELANELTAAKDEMQGYIQTAKESGNDARLLLKELNAAEVLAGLTDVTGPGVTVTVQDNPNVNGGFATEDDIVHYEDLILIVNELRAAGAEAIGINKERITARTEIRCVGPTVIVNGNRVTVPFEIKAIGDSTTLYNSLTMPGGMVSYITTRYPIKIDIERVSSITIEGYKGGNSTFRHAVPVVSIQGQGDDE